MNKLGTLFSVEIFGESHGPSVGVIIDGCPAGIEITKEDFVEDINRRKSGSFGTTRRLETDKPIIQSGIFQNRTTGTPISIIFENNNIRSEDYELHKHVPRPGHADFSAYQKFGGFHDYRGGGHFSGRLTLPLVAAGVLAKKVIDPVIVSSSIIEIGGEKNYEPILKQAISEGDSLGGIISCTVSNVYTGLGEPFFNSMESLISHAVFSIPGIKGIEFGAGFNITKMKGSQANDVIVNSSGYTETNHSGGINGGISNGNEIVFSAAVRPTASISCLQKSIDLISGSCVDFQITGRHDVCFALRVPVIIEAATAIILADLILQEQYISRIKVPEEPENA